MAEGEHESATADKLIDIMAPLLSGADGEAWANGALFEQPTSGNQCGLDTHYWRRCSDSLSRALVLLSSHGHRVATNTSGSSRPRAGSDLSLSLFHSARGVRGSSHGVYVHHVGEAGTPRTTKSLPYLVCQMSKWFYDTSTDTAIRAALLWFFVREGLSL
jgi:hypothetical protein